MAPTSQVEDRLHESSGSVDSLDHVDVSLPAVKKELRDFIAKKRQEEGMPLVDSRLWDHEPVHFELTAEEKSRISHRRERNREAARKSRERRRDEMEKLRKENDAMSLQLETLQRELLWLRQVQQEMTSLLIQHHRECERLALNPEFVEAHRK